GPEADAPADAPWPALLPERVAKALGVSPGESLAIWVKDDEARERIQAVRVVGALADASWPARLPELVLPYYPAQAVDSPRLNARAHELLLVPKPGAAPAALAKAATERSKPLIRTWQQIQPDMAKLIETQDVWVGIMLFIIFAIAALTVMNTMLMAVWERTREFGVLKAIGMRPGQVVGLIVFETLFLALIAGIVGGAIGLGLNHWAVSKGIDLSAWTGGFTYQGAFIDPVWRAAHSVKVIAIPIVMVELVCLLVSFYPAFRAGRLKPVAALRHNG
ncbi:MAG: FtsX-like permease family protein, partial [Polyangia bacterium]|nr:FtsX-like permease family protein [Polyangia bacterium]